MPIRRAKALCESHPACLGVTFHHGLKSNGGATAGGSADVDLDEPPSSFDFSESGLPEGLDLDAPTFLNFKESAEARGGACASVCSATYTAPSSPRVPAPPSPRVPQQPARCKVVSGGGEGWGSYVRPGVASRKAVMFPLTCSGEMFRDILPPDMASLGLLTCATRLVNHACAASLDAVPVVKTAERWLRAT